MKESLFGRSVVLCQEVLTQFFTFYNETWYSITSILINQQQMCMTYFSPITWFIFHYTTIEKKL